MPRTVEDGFVELLERQRLTARQSETAETRISGIDSFLANEFSYLETLTIGSYARQTICRPERDVDLLAVFHAFGTTGYWDRHKDDSADFLYLVRNALNARYHATNVSSRRVAIVLDFTDIAVDVVPAFHRKGGGYLMPNGSGGWQATNPPFHHTAISDQDTKHSGKLKQLIRLVKFWNLQNDHILHSFHLELLVSNMWQSATIGQYSSAVKETLRVLQTNAFTELRDPWGPGQLISGYLTSEQESQFRRIVESDTQTAKEAEDLRIANRTEEAFQRWNTVYRQGFPAY